MKHLITCIAAGLLLFVMTADVNAQNRDRGNAMQGQGQGMGQGMGLMHDLAIIYSGDLNLTEVQKQEIARIRAENRVEARQMRSEVQRQRNQRSERPQAFRQQRQENRASMYEKIQEVLTPEQREQVTAMRAERMENQEEMQQNMAAAYVEIVSEDIGLDEEKTLRLTEIVREHRAEMSDVRAERRTSAERPDMTVVHEAHQMQLMNKVREVLTEEEFELWSEQWQELMPRQMEMRRSDRGRQNDNRINRNRQN